MMSDDSLFHRMLQNRHSYALGGPISEAAKQIAQIQKQALGQQPPQKPEELRLTEFDRDFLKDLKVKA